MGERRRIVDATRREIGARRTNVVAVKHEQDVGFHLLPLDHFSSGAVLDPGCKAAMDAPWSRGVVRLRQMHEVEAGKSSTILQNPVGRREVALDLRLDAFGSTHRVLGAGRVVGDDVDPRSISDGRVGRCRHGTIGSGSGDAEGGRFQRGVERLAVPNGGHGDDLFDDVHPRAGRMHFPGPLGRPHTACHDIAVHNQNDRPHLRIRYRTGKRVAARECRGRPLDHGDVLNIVEQIQRQRREAPSAGLLLYGVQIGNVDPHGSASEGYVRIVGPRHHRDSRRFVAAEQTLRLTFRFVASEECDRGPGDRCCGHRTPRALRARDDSIQLQTPNAVRVRAPEAVLPPHPGTPHREFSLVRCLVPTARSRSATSAYATPSGLSSL